MNLDILYSSYKSIIYTSILTLMALIMSASDIVAQGNSYDGWLTDSVILHIKSYYNPKTDSARILSKAFFDNIEEDLLRLKDQDLKKAKDSINARQAFMYSALFRRQQENNLKKAKELLHEAHIFLNPHKKHHQFAQWIEGSLANIATRQFDYERSQHWQKKAIQHYQQTESDKYLLYALCDFTNNLIYQYDTILARKYLKLIWDESHKLNNDKARSTALSTQIIYDKTVHAESFTINYKEQIFLVDKLYITGIKKSRILANLEEQCADFLLQENNYKKALQHINEALIHQENVDQGKNISRSKADKLNLKAQILLASGKKKEALLTAEYGLQNLIGKLISSHTKEIKESLYADNKFVWLYNTMGDILVEMAEDTLTFNGAILKKALECYQLALYVNELLESDLSTKNSRAIQANRHRYIINKMIDISYDLYTEYKLITLDEVLLLFTEAKNRIWYQNLRDKYHLTNISEDDLDKISTYKNKILRLSDTPEEQIEWYDSINFVHTRYGLEKLPLSSISNYYDYVITDQNLYVLTDLEAPYFYKLSDKSIIKNTFLEFESSLIERNYVETDEHLRQLSNILLPFQKIPKVLHIIPDGYLTHIPFDALYKEDTQLIEFSTISYIYHHKQRDYAKSDSNSHKKIYLLRPDYITAGYTTPASMRSELGILPAAKQEIASIKSLFGKDALELSSTSIKDSILLYAKADIFHFAGHAKALDTSTYLALTSSDGAISKLKNEDLYHWPYSYDLVVLSACETGLGAFTNGEAIKSLGSNLLQSGTKSVIHTSWVANDRSTSTIITSFYKHLKNGQTKSNALRLAKLDYLRSAQPALRHPYYWAGIHLVGETSPSFNKAHRSLYYLAILPIVILIFIIKQIYEKLKNPHFM